MGQIGNYLHMDGHIQRKTYGESRGLTILLSNAFNAGGIIGSEYNGIVILDDDYSSVVLDKHFCNRSKLDQLDEYERICGMEWKELCEFITAHPNVRRNLAYDIYSHSTVPDPGNIRMQKACGREIDLSKGDDIRTEEMKKYHNDEKVEYSFPHRTRNEIIDFLISHEKHNEYGRPFRLAWNIKVYSMNETGHIENGEKINPVYDKLWAGIVEHEGHLIWNEATLNALRPYLDKEYTVYPGVNQERYSFEVEGRSGGWLVLSKIDDSKIEMASLHQAFDDFDEMANEELLDIYEVVVNLDHDLGGNKPRESMEYEFSFIRSSFEEKWQDMDELISDIVNVKLPASDIVELLEKSGCDRDLFIEKYKEYLGEAEEVDELLEVMSQISNGRK